MDKLCCICRRWKDTEQFNRTKWTKDGRKHRCRDCDRQLQREVARANGVIQKRIVKDCGTSRKQCFDCRKIKKLDQFSPSIRGKLGRSAYCKPCLSKRVTKDKSKHSRRTKKWRTENRDEYLIQHSACMLKRRAKKRSLDSGLVTTAVVRGIMSIEICCYCGLKVDLHCRTVEHKIPLSRGGPHHPDNLGMSCRPCNSSKRNKTPEEWDGFQGVYFS